MNTTFLASYLPPEETLFYMSLLHLNEKICSKMSEFFAPRGKKFSHSLETRKQASIISTNVIYFHPGIEKLLTLRKL